MPVTIPRMRGGGRGRASNAPSPAQRRARTRARIQLLLLTVGTAGVLALASAGYISTRYRAPHLGHVTLRRVDPGSVAALESVFRRADYQWPPADSVPPIAVANLPPGLDQVKVARRKTLFFQTVLPLVVAENTRIRRERRFLKRQFAAGKIEPGSRAALQVQRIAKAFDVDGQINDPSFRKTLLRRVDVVPPGLVLAQAATESGWGTSRFAVEGNNLFGIWTWDADRGLTPRRRRPNADHYVRTYRNLRSSVHNYIMNIDTRDAYSELRQLRAFLRRKGQTLDPSRLVVGLRLYSSRRGDYVHDIRAMIRMNNLNRLVRLQLAQDS